MSGERFRRSEEDIRAAEQRRKDAEIRVVDYTHSCPLCEPVSKETYELLAQCDNCGEQHIAVINKGQTPSPNKTCPHCGVAWKIRFGTSAQAAEARKRST